MTDSACIMVPDPDLERHFTSEWVVGDSPDEPLSSAALRAMAPMGELTLHSAGSERDACRNGRDSCRSAASSGA